MTDREMVLHEALDRLVQKLDAMENPVNDALLIAGIHGMPYNGPTWEKEMASAKKVLEPVSEGQRPDELRGKQMKQTSTFECAHCGRIYDDGLAKCTSDDCPGLGLLRCKALELALIDILECKHEDPALLRMIADDALHSVQQERVSEEQKPTSFFNRFGGLK